MKKYVNGEYIDLTAEEIAEDIASNEAHAEQADRKYWDTVSYDDAVNAEIRERYTESAEFAILRQKDEKPEEYTAYYAYCEECKALVKEKKSLT